MEFVEFLEFAKLMVRIEGTNSTKSTNSSTFKMKKEGDPVSNIIPMNSDSESIYIEKSQEYIDSTREVSDYIGSLPLSREHNNTLIAMLVEHLNIRAKDAFAHGFYVGVKSATWVIEHEDEEED